MKRILLGAILALATTQAYAKDIQTAVFAGGCFWCVEADYDKVKGVTKTVSGFTGGSTKNPTYKEVTSGGTGHYEAVKITYDADIVSYEELVDVFWRSVDATDAGGQFCDRGESYRTAIFANKAQKPIAQASKKALTRKNTIGKVVTPILNVQAFYPADSYHQDYYKQSKKVLTRFGLISKAQAYKNYRKACGRDARVKQLWGNDAFVVRGL